MMATAQQHPNFCLACNALHLGQSCTEYHAQKEDRSPIIPTMTKDAMDDLYPPLAPPIDYAERLWELRKLEYKRDEAIASSEDLSSLRSMRFDVEMGAYRLYSSARVSFPEMQEATEQETSLRKEASEINAQISKLLEDE